MNVQEVHCPYCNDSPGGCNHCRMPWGEVYEGDDTSYDLDVGIPRQPIISPKPTTSSSSLNNRQSLINTILVILMIFGLAVYFIVTQFGIHLF